MRAIAPDKLAWLDHVTLSAGAHNGHNGQACAMEAAAFIAGEPWSDHPQCVSPVIAAFCRTWQDALPDNETRDRLVKPLVLATLNTATGAADDERRAWMATDWLVRVHTPAWLRLAGLDANADALAGLPELTGGSQFPGIKPVLEAARRDANAAWGAAWDAARAAAWAAAWAAARAAAWDAAWAAARDAAWDAARAAARAAAWDAAWAAAWAATRAKLAPTVDELQASAADLVLRMCEVGR